MWIYLKKYPNDMVIMLIYLLVLILTTEVKGMEKYDCISKKNCSFVAMCKTNLWS